jgi:hypothetical protein
LQVAGIQHRFLTLRNENGCWWTGSSYTVPALPSKREALSSNPSPPPKKERNENGFLKVITDILATKTERRDRHLGDLGF